MSVMFFVKEPSTLGTPWNLSGYDEEKPIVISKETTKDLKNFHILGVDFLYQNYKKQFKGSILNEEDGLNMQLQVSAFLNAMFNYIKKKFLILVLSPDDLIVKWHYHLTVHGGLRVQVIGDSTCSEDFHQDHGVALLLSFTNIKLAETLLDYDYFSVVIDSFDKISTKLVIRKLYGDFNIGLTQRNFYINPDQKLQWTMLNWCNPGCVGKLSDFYEIDSDNFANIRDNYRHWWLRLTWSFCESFKKLSEKEIEEYDTVLLKWAKTNQLTDALKTEKKLRKRKKRKSPDNCTIGENADLNLDEKDESKNQFKKKNIKQPIIVHKNEELENNDDTSSQDTIIYEDGDLIKNEETKYIQVASMDVNSIMKNFDNSPLSVIQSPVSSSELKMEPKLSDDEDILMSIINDANHKVRSPKLDRQTQVSYKKEELLSQIFDEASCSSRNVLQCDDADFILSLVD